MNWDAIAAIAEDRASLETHIQANGAAPIYRWCLASTASTHFYRAEFTEFVQRAMGAVNLLPQAKWFRAKICEARGDDDASRTLLHAAMDDYRERGAMGQVRALANELGIEP